MDVNTLIETLLKMPVGNSKAIKLQEVVVEILRSGQSLTLHNGEVNLSSLAVLVGCTRQSFYPGRGHGDMLGIVSILNSHASVLADCAPSAAPPKLGKLNISLHKVLSENEALQRELRKSQARWKDLYNQRLVVD
ncbi:hypothetical protein ACUUYP_06980 [Pseudomonas lundensis]|uniref:hypothetical protein n=1 Tax=Pseudomonas lundensis TaxID=86185 RepID=UPI0040463080